MLLLCLITHNFKDVWGSGGINSHTLNLISRWRLVVTFMPHLLYPQHQLDIKVVGSIAGLDAGVKREIFPP
jgi:hypothetical protein